MNLPTARNGPAESSYRKLHFRVPGNLIVLLGLMGVTNAAAAYPLQAPQTSQRRLPNGFVSKTLKIKDQRDRKYAVFVPPQYGASQTHRWPLILFLHGSGECGMDGIKHTTQGLPVYISKRATRFPFLVVMPQAQQNAFRGPEAAAVWAILDEVDRSYRVDHDRIFLTGLSMGGIATWELAVLRPDVFAAIVPVCGFAPNEYLSNIKDLPVWAFHGALDQNVSVSGSRDAIGALRKLGATPKYTEYPDLAHVCWDRAYAEPELYKWLLKQRRGPPPKVIDYLFPGGMSRVWWLAAEAEPGGKRPARIHAEIREGGHVVLTSENVAGWGLVSNGPPLPPESDIRVEWNGNEVYQGKFEGLLKMEPTKPTTQPSAKPAQAAP
ncbi:MAG TPA: PHB depolymerase family esterase [Phycisphaerae bacterium]|nr:PHB depolymerase family esterase [Phycisphaerae bacterium]